MVDACTITRVIATTTDPTSGAVVDDVEVVYAGKCRVQQPGIASAIPDTAGAQYVRLVQLQLQLPMSVTGLREGDRVVINTSATDPDLPGRRLVVRELAHKTDATSRRVGCTEET